MQIKDLIVTGDAKVLGTLSTKGGEVATKADLANMTLPYTYSTTDLTPGSSPLQEGKLYFVYE